MSQLLSAHNLSHSFAGKTLFQNVNLGIFEKDRIGLVGPNGAGKSTLLKILCGVLEPDRGEVVKRRGLRVGYLAQTPAFTKQETLFEAVIAKAHDPDEAMGRAYEWISKLGLDQFPFDIPVSSLSGGWRKRVALARELITEPDLILLDEPTNHLDLHAVKWLEEFLLKFENTVITVSHDRYFLNKVCTHIADIDYGKISIYTGNYDFWRQSSELKLRLMSDQNKKNQDKAEDLKAFIARFSANASKSAQASSRRKILEKLEINDLPVSSRKQPFIGFDLQRPLGKDVLTVDKVCKSFEGRTILKNVSFTLQTGDKAILLGKSDLAKTFLLEILNGDMQPDSGTVTWGLTVSKAYFPNDNAKFFQGNEESLVDWLRPFSTEKDLSFLRGFLGKMLFSGEDALKKPSVLSGGEKARCMYSKMMLSGANFLLLDGPTNHLDLESITAVNEALKKYKGSALFTSHDHELIQTVVNRVIEIDEGVTFDDRITFEDYLAKREFSSTP